MGAQIEKTSLSASAEVCQQETIFVDVDGTLLVTDTFSELCIRIYWERPWVFFVALPLWLLQGRSRIRSGLQRYAELKPEELKFNPSLLKYLEKRKSEGARLILATGSLFREAQDIASYLEIFEATYASACLKKPLIGSRKLELLRDFPGVTEFTYVGNSYEDLVIWQHAKEVIMVNPFPGIVWLAEPTLTFRSKAGFEFFPLMLLLGCLALVGGAGIDGAKAIYISCLAIFYISNLVLQRRRTEDILQNQLSIWCYLLLVHVSMVVCFVASIGISISILPLTLILLISIYKQAFRTLC